MGYLSTEAMSWPVLVGSRYGSLPSAFDFDGGTHNQRSNLGC